MGPRVTRDPVIQKAVELWEEGLTYPEIGERLSIDPTTVYLWLESRYSIEPSPRGVRALARRAKVKREAEQGIAEIEASLGSTSGVDR